MNSLCSKLYTNHINYWSEFPPPRHIYLKNKLKQQYFHRDIHLWLSLFIKPGRENELLTCLELNLNNPFIKKVTVILEGSQLPGQFMNHPKLHVINKTAKWRTKYSDILDEIDENSNEINIVANNDIVISYKNLDFLFRLTRNDLAVLSRWETKAPYSRDIAHYENNSKLITNIGSSDTWIFIQKPSVTSDIYLGIPGCENMFINEFYNADYNIVNLGNIIPSYHLHEKYNVKQSYPFTYYYSSMYAVTFIDFYSEINGIENFSLHNLYELDNYKDFYSKLSIIFSSFWNLSIEKDLTKLDHAIEQEYNTVKDNIIKVEGPRLKEQLLKEERDQIHTIINHEYNEKQKIIENSLIEFKNNKQKQVLQLCDELKAKEIEKNKLEIEEYSRSLREQEIERGKTEIKKTLEKYESEYKEQFQRKWKEQVNVEREQKLQEIEKACSDLYSRKINEINIKTAQIEKDILGHIEQRKAELLQQQAIAKVNTQREIDNQQAILQEKTKTYQSKRSELDSLIADSQIELNNKAIELANKLFKITNDFDNDKKGLEEKFKEFQTEMLRKQEEETLRFQSIVDENNRRHQEKLAELHYDYNKKVKEESLNLNNFFFTEKKKIEDDLNNIRNSKIEQINADILAKQNEYNSVEGLINKLITDFRNKEDELRKREFQIKDEIDGMEALKAEKLEKINNECRDKLKSESDKLNTYLFEQRKKIETQITETYSKNLEEMTRNVKEKEEFYKKYFDEKEKTKQEVDTKLQELTERYTTKIREYNAELLETETKLASIELVRRRKFMQLENDCKEYERNERERVATEARAMFEKLQEEYRNNAIEQDEVERKKLKVERETEHENELERLKKKLNDEIEEDHNAKKKQYSDKLKKFFQLESEKVNEEFNNKRIAAENEFEDIKTYNNNVNVETVKNFISDFSKTVSKAYNNLESEIEGKRVSMMAEVDEVLQQYKINKKHDIDRDCFTFRATNIKHIEDDIKTLKESRIKEIEKECNETKIRKLNETFAEILAESEKHKKLLGERELMLEKQRIMTHNDKIKSLESEFLFKYNEATKKHVDAVEEMKKELSDNYVKIKEKLDIEIEMLKKEQDKEFNQYKLNLHHQIELEREKMMEEVRQYRQTLMSRAMMEHETEKGILRQERETEHNQEIALLMQKVSKIVADRENEMTFNMMNEVIKKREEEEKKLEREIGEYKDNLLREAENSVKELNNIKELLVKSNIEAEQKRIESFQESQRMCVDMLADLENRRILEIESNLIKRITEADEAVRQKQLENNVKEDQRIIALRKANEAKIDEYRKTKLKAIDKEISDDVMRQKNKLIKEFTDVQNKENEKLKEERNKYHEEQKSIINERIKVDYELKLEEVNKKILQEEEIRMKKLQIALQEKDKKDTDARNEKMKLYMIDLNIMIQDEKKKIEEERQAMLKSLEDKEREISDEKEKAQTFIAKVKQEAKMLLASANEQKRKVMSDLEDERIHLEAEIQNLRDNFEEEKNKALKKIIEAQKRAAELINGALN